MIGRTQLAHVEHGPEYAERHAWERRVAALNEAVEAAATAMTVARQEYRAATRARREFARRHPAPEP